MLTPNVNQFIPQDYYASLPTTMEYTHKWWLYGQHENCPCNHARNFRHPFTDTNFRAITLPQNGIRKPFEKPHLLDAKKSPLALLAQTCSQIGSDSSNPLASKTSHSPPEKMLKSREKSSPSSSSNGSSPVTIKSSFKPYESCLRDSEKSVASISSVERKTSPPKATPAESIRTLPSPARTSPAQRAPSSSSSSDHRPLSNPTTSSPHQTTKSSDPISSLKSLSLPASSSGPYIPGYPSLPLDVMASSLLSSSHSLKAGMHPYLNYSRLKTAASAADSMLSVCRDPYCTNCQLSSHLLAVYAHQNKSCPPGCTQCDIAKSPNFLASGHDASLAYAYAQMQLAALASSQMPYICSWVGAEGPCGKRFLTAEERLQHLRTHTSDPLVSAASSAVAAAHPLLSRTYPTPPISPLTTAAARYHPYSKPPFLPPSLFPLPGNPALHPTAAAAAAAGFPPYLFYNSKLGSTPHH